MVKYSPKENSYKEMYLINKFEKNIMENSLQNLRNNKKDLIDKSVTTNNVYPEGRKETIENHGEKILQSLPSDTIQEHNEIAKKLRPHKRKQLIKLRGKIDTNVLDIISLNRNLSFAIDPNVKIYYNNNEWKMVTSLKSKEMYKTLIGKRIKLPAGVLNWSNKLNLPPDNILMSIPRAFNSTLSTKARQFQYKVSTYTLATGEYLCNYRVRDTYSCFKCNSEFGERDNIAHSLFYCPKVYPFIEFTFEFLINECRAADHISFADYIFGIQSTHKAALNSVLIEIKRYIFYDWSENTSIRSKCKVLKK